MSRLRRLLDLVYEHQVLSWIGVFVGLAGIVAPQAVELPSWLSAIFLTAGWPVATILLVALIIGSLDSAEVACDLCTKTYELVGARGRELRQVEVMRLRFKSSVRLLTLSHRSASAEFKKDEFRIRPVNDDGEAHPDPFVPPNIFSAYEGGGVHSRKIELPEEMKRGQCLEVQSVIEADDCFPEDSESVGKNVLFPTERLSFTVNFRGCQPRNASGAVKEPGRPDRGFKILPIEMVDGGYRIEYSVQDLKPGETCLVSWTWSDVPK